MEKQTFPTDTLLGLVFNDFINDDPGVSILNTYSPYADRTVQLPRSHGLIMNEAKIELLGVDREHLIPEWMFYQICNPTTIARLNRFISTNMTRTQQGSCCKCYRHHESGIWICITKSSDNYFTYWLFKERKALHKAAEGTIVYIR